MGTSKRSSLWSLAAAILVTGLSRGGVGANDLKHVAQAAGAIASIDAAGRPAIAVLVAREGQVVFQAAIGMADVAAGRSATVDTRFRIGSVTKQFTAAAILKLVDDGKLSLDDTLDKHLPDFPRGDEVTIAQLLNHTSGIPSYTDDPEFFATVTQPLTQAQVIAKFAGKPFSFQPGEDFHYNNSGYFLLGHLVGKVSGRSLGDYWQETFFKPLGMINTGVHTPQEDVNGGQALGHSVVGGDVDRAVDWDMSQAGGAGNLYSTVGDLMRWNEAVFGGRVLTRSSSDAAWTPRGAAAASNYGFGWTIDQYRGLRRIQHNGGLQGFQSVLVRYPDQQLTIAVLHNAMPGPDAMNPESIAIKMADVFLADQLKPVADRVVDQSVDPDVYDRYVGRYDYGTAVMTVSRVDDRLFVQLTGQPQFEAFPESPTKFFLKVVDAQIEFIVAADGPSTAVRHHQNSHEFTAQRLDDVQLPPMTARSLEPFVGKYDYGTATMVVTREGDQLFAQLSGQPRFPIFATGNDEFVWKVVSASIKFSRDENGRVIAGEHTQNGVTFRVPRLDTAAAK